MQIAILMDAIPSDTGPCMWTMEGLPAHRALFKGLLRLRLIPEWRCGFTTLLRKK